MNKTLKEAGYTHIKNLGDGMHLLMDSFGGYGRFIAKRNFTNPRALRLIYKSTYLELVDSVSYDEAQRLIYKMK